MKYNISVTKSKQSRLADIDFSNLPFGKFISDHMFVSDFDGENWTDMRIVPYEKFEIAPSNLALHYGQSVFEGMKASKIKGVPTLMRPEMHARRLNLSANRMCMPSIPEDLFVDALTKLIDLDRNWIPDQDDHSLYIRPFMFATDELFGVQPSKTYRFIIFTGPVGPYYSKAIRLWVEEVYTRAAQGGAGEAKCAGNYGSALLPAMQAKKAGYDQIMWMDSDQKRFVQEVGTMNLFFVIDGKVITPATTGTILRGITRDCFITILKDAGYVVEDRLLSIQEIADAYWRGALQECFGTGTAAVVSHIADITWRDRVIELPPADEAHRPVAFMLKNYLNNLRMGRIADRYHWMHSCDNSGVMNGVSEQQGVEVLA